MLPHQTGLPAAIFDLDRLGALTCWFSLMASKSVR